MMTRVIVRDGMVTGATRRDFVALCSAVNRLPVLPVIMILLYIVRARVVVLQVERGPVLVTERREVRRTAA